MADLQGFHVQLTIDLNDVTMYCNDVTLARNVAAMSKATMDGLGVPQLLSGMETGTMSMSGQVDTAGQELLEATWAKRAPVAFTLVVGDGGTLDAGTYTGDVLLSGFEVAAMADDSWNFSLDGSTTAVTFTPPA